jgi:hypothetical protein
MEINIVCIHEVQKYANTKKEQKICKGNRTTNGEIKKDFMNIDKREENSQGKKYYND